MRHLFLSAWAVALAATAARAEGPWLPVGLGGGGALWRRCEGVTGQVVGAVLRRAAASAPAGPKYNFLATKDGIFRSTDLSRGYAPCGTGLPAGAVTSFSGGAKASVLRLYVTVE